ncbi:uncharacterized protein METZ01_LOCUS221701, partial [marine metagenome]
MYHTTKNLSIVFLMFCFIQAESRGLNWCKTMEHWKKSVSYTRNCEENGDPDQPSIRDSYIPTDGTDIVDIKI